MHEYVREITLTLIVKTIRVNAKLFFSLLVLVSLIIVLVFSTINSRVPVQYQTAGLVRINNYGPDTTADQQIVDTSKSNNMPSGASLAARSEIEAALLPTEYILGPVIEKNHLNIQVGITLLPVFEKVLSKFYPGSEMNNPFYKNTPYAFGYETLNVSVFDIEPQYLNKGFKVVILGEDTYKLLFGQKYILTGTVGKVESGDGITIKVDSMDGDKGVQFSLQKNSMDKSIADLASLIDVDQVAAGKKIISPITGLLKISMTGTNPVIQSHIINDIMDQLKQLALEQQVKVLESSINFVENQIIKVNKSLKDSQTALVSFQTVNSVINLNSQATETIHDLSATEQNIVENEIAIIQYSALYTKNHPLMISLFKRRDELASNKQDLIKRLNKFPKNESMYLYLKSNLDVNQQLYLFLLNKDQDLKIKFSSISNPVEILNYAPSDVVPIVNKVTLKSIAGLLGIILVCMIVIVMNLLFWGNSDPRMMPELIKTPLLAVIPHLGSPQGTKAHRSFELVISYLLQKHQAANRNLVVNMGSITEASGKSFITSMIIQYMNRMGKKSLFIKFGLGDSFKTIPNIISQIQQVEHKEVGLDEYLGLEIDVISAMDDKMMQELLSHLKGFDFIFLSATPILKSALFLTLSNVAMENILVVSPKDTRNKLELCIDDFKNLNVKLDRIIFNNPRKTFIKSVYLLLYDSYNQ